MTSTTRRAPTSRTRRPRAWKTAGRGHPQRPDEHAHRILLAELGSDTLHLGARVTGFEDRGDGVEVQPADGASQRADVLVAADGLYSTVRARLHGDEPPRFAGYTAQRAVVKDSGGLDPPRLVRLAVGARKAVRLLRHRARPDLLDERREQRHTPGRAPGEGALKALLAERHRGWADPVERMIEATPEEALHATDIYDRPPLEQWERRGCCWWTWPHPMTFNSGQGAGSGMEDAVVLAAARKAGADDLPAALRDYEARRRPRHGDPPGHRLADEQPRPHVQPAGMHHARRDDARIYRRSGSKSTRRTWPSRCERLRRGCRRRTFRRALGGGVPGQGRAARARLRAGRRAGRPWRAASPARGIASTPRSTSRLGRARRTARRPLRHLGVRERVSAYTRLETLSTRRLRLRRRGSKDAPADREASLPPFGERFPQLGGRDPRPSLATSRLSEELRVAGTQAQARDSGRRPGLGGRRYPTAFRLSNATLGDVLEEHVADPRARAALGRQPGSASAAPARAAFLPWAGMTSPRCTTAGRRRKEVFGS